MPLEAQQLKFSHRVPNQLAASSTGAGRWYERRLSQEREFKEITASYEEHLGWWHSFCRLGVAAALVVVLAGLSLGLSTYSSYQRYPAGAADNLQNLTLNLERYLFTRFQSADIALQSAAQSFAGLGAGPQLSP